ncbi:unnamed protein product [Prorocentrum cordatum]|uniref:SREBP regulating gene protein n=1 Tax=Prorocentrum cordatum TaxID=2364126 RepID=A0ABN9RE05_9DINO|nr:unnamed protein product [Polarella glacialis]
MALAGLLGLALLLRGVPASQEAESCEAAGGCEEAGLAQLRASLATKGGDSDQEEGGCKSNGKLCHKDDMCCSGHCPGRDAANPLGRCADGASLAQTDESQGGATKGGASDEEEGGCRSKGKVCAKDGRCCSGSCVGVGESEYSMWGRCS